MDRRMPKGARAAWLVLGLGLLLGMDDGVAWGDVIYLTSGGTLTIEAWRDAGDAIEFTRFGGIMRIDKRDIVRIDGQSVKEDLRMYSAPASLSGSSLRDASTREAALRQMTELLGQGEELFGQTLLSSRSKADAFRRLVVKWRDVDAPEALGEPATRGQEALQLAVDAYTADEERAVPDAKERIEAAKKALQAAQGLVKKAGAEGAGG